MECQSFFLRARSISAVGTFFTFPLLVSELLVGPETGVFWCSLDAGSFASDYKQSQDKYLDVGSAVHSREISRMWIQDV